MGLLDLFSRRRAKVARPTGRAILARYDAAQTTDDNRRLWANADGLSARAANSAEVRRVLRNRARYERSNNSYLEGITQTLANDTVGTGPRLQLLTSDVDLNRRVEREFATWSRSVCLAAKLRTLRMARVIDGEAFALLTTNPTLPTTVHLDVRLIECDQVATPHPFPLDPLAVDGMRLDEHGNVVEYHVLRQHPGDLASWGLPHDFDRVPASHVLHWYRVDRPGQYRGVPEITSALADFPELRRYAQAVLAAAETAADFAAMLYSEAPSVDDDAEAGQSFETLEIAKRMMTVLPAGHRVEQLRAEHPRTNHPEFERQTLNRIVRCLNMPLNVALGNSSGYNYASGRLDHQTYHRSIRVDQSHLAAAVLDPILRAWLAEASLAGLSTIAADGADPWPHQWFWDGAEHVDPQKEASAQAQRLANGTTTYAIEYARQGRDWEVEFAQLALEAERRRELGLVLPGGASATAGTRAATPTETEEEGDGDDAPEGE